MGSGEQAEMYGSLVVQGSTLGNLDRIDLTDKIGGTHIGGSEFLNKTSIPRDIVYREFISQFLKLTLTVNTYRVKRVIMNGTAFNGGHLFIQEVYHGPDKPALALTSFTQQNHVMSAEDGIHQIGNHRLIIADQFRK